MEIREPLRFAERCSHELAGSGLQSDRGACARVARDMRVDGNPTPGVGEVTLDGTGTGSLAGLNLNTATGLPQFVISLVGEKNAVGSVVVKLT